MPTHAPLAEVVLDWVDVPGDGGGGAGGGGEISVTVAANGFVASGVAIATAAAVDPTTPSVGRDSTAPTATAGPTLAAAAMATGSDVSCTEAGGASTGVGVSPWGGAGSIAEPAA